MQVLDYLDDMGIEYNLDVRLVRGLDYYNRTVFEFFEDGTVNRGGPSEEKKEGGDEANKGGGKEGTAGKGSLGGGGRYDYLMEMIGGRATAAVGLAVGAERVIAAMKERGKPASRLRSAVYFIHVGEVAKKKSLKLVEELRENGIPVKESLSKDLLSKQLALASKEEGVETVLIFGQREVYEESIIIKNLSTGIQETVAVGKMVEEVKKRLK